ncbi:MAG: AAA family ATPase [Candidatus Micrarchaeia archaeon]
MIIAIAGRPGAGKSALAALLKRRGFTVIELSAQIKLLMQKEHMRVNPYSILEEGKALRRKYGKAAVARLALEHNKIGRDMVFSGLRSKSELNYLRKSLGKGVTLIYVTAPDRIRLKRLKIREPAYTAALMAHRDREEDKFGMGGLESSADFIVSNVSSFKSLSSDLGVILAMMRRGRSRR